MNPARLVTRVVNRYAVRIARSTPDEIDATIDFASKDLELHPEAWKALLVFRKAIISHKATKRERDAILEDLDFDIAKRRDKKDAKSKSLVKKNEKLKKLLTSDSVNAVLT